MIEHFYVCRKCAFQILRTFILYIEQQHRWFPVDKKCDQSVHFCMRNSYFPVIFSASVSSAHNPALSLWVVITASPPVMAAIWRVSSLAPPTCPESTEMTKRPVLSTQTTAGSLYLFLCILQCCVHRFPWHQ